MIRFLMIILLLLAKTNTLFSQDSIYYQGINDPIKPSQLRLEHRKTILPNRTAAENNLNKQKFDVFRSLQQRALSRVAYSSLDTCATLTYRLKIGNTNREEFINGITRVDSSNLLITGKLKEPLSSYEALLIKLNPSGNFLWGRTYSENNSQIEFKTARNTLDGGIIAVGSIINTTLNEGWLLVCKLDKNGNQEWTRRLKSPVPGVMAHGADIIQLSDTSYLFTGDNVEAVIYGKINSSGNLLWSKTISPFSINKAIRILEDYNGHFLIATGEEAGFKVATVCKVSLTDGSFVWGRKFGGAASNSNYIFHKAEIVNGRPRITGIYSEAGQPYKFMRITVNTGSLIERIDQYSVTGITPDNTSFSATDPVSQAMFYKPSNSVNNLVLIKNNPDVVNIEWSRTYTNTAPFSLAAMEKTFDAGFIAGLNSNNDILLIKTDSTGLNPGCASSDANTAKSLLSPDIPSVTYPVTPASWTISGISLTQNIKQFDNIYECKQLTCPTRPPEDTCLLSFYKTYRSYDFTELATGLSETTDDNIIISGISRTNGYDPLTDAGFVLKLSKKGILLKKERWLLGDRMNFSKQIKLSDGNTLLIAIVNDETNYGFALLKTDADLNMIWHKFYRFKTPESWGFCDVAEGDNGAIFLYNYAFNFGNLDDRNVIIKFDNMGNLLWERNYRQAGGISLLGNGANLSAESGFLYVNTLMLSNNNNKWITLLMKLDQSNGAVVWARNYTFGTTLEARLGNGMQVLNGRIYLNGYIPFSANTDNNAWVKISPNGIPEKTKVEILPNTTYSHNSTMTEKGEIISINPLNMYTVPGGQIDFFLKMDTNFNVLVAKKTPSLKFVFNYASIQSNDGTMFTTGASFYEDPYNGDVTLRRHQENGELGTCLSDTIQFPGQEFLLSTSDFSVLQNINNSFEPHFLPLIRLPFSIQQNQLLCGSQINCDTLWLEGENNICDTVQQYTFRARKNNGCNAGVSWDVTGQGIKIIKLTDSSIIVKFSQNGIATIKSKLFTGCRWYADSITVNIQPSPAVLNLGLNSELCEGNTRLLNAGKGFTSYLWQDGSTDSTFNVTAPGIYWVQTGTACNTYLRDTVIISAAPPIPFDLGPNRLKCNTDSITINAPSGFLNYSWSPSYNITSTNAQSTILFPAKDTIYYVRAEKSPGCFAIDSIRITVNRSADIALGKDTSFCTGSSIKLNAGGGFLNYLWSNGSTDSSINVSTAGIYFVTAKDINNCISRDTLKVVQVFSLPQVQLPKDHAICKGTNEILNATAQNVSYSWNTGDTTAAISVNTPGLYYVIITDNNGCKNSDSTRITGILPLPASFLPKDSSLCSFAQLEIAATGRYNNYLWNTGSNNSLITITKPGIYWLQVTDNNNCKGRDSILISPKQCLEGFFIPSAFTPNNDGLNDDFKPLLFGKTERFHFKVYTRWGEKIFETTDVNKGWNGKIKGQEQDSNVFVWECLFKFENQAPQHRKGIVTLIK